MFKKKSHTETYLHNYNKTFQSYIMLFLNDAKYTSIFHD